MTITATATKLMVALLIKVKVVLINVIIKIRIKMNIAEKLITIHNKVNHIIIEKNHKHENIDKRDYQNTNNKQ